jgi:hypothetical protein
MFAAEYTTTSTASQPPPDTRKGRHYLGGANPHAGSPKHRTFCTNRICELGRVSDSCLENTTQTDEQIRRRGLMINMIPARGAPANLLSPPLSHPSFDGAGAPSPREPRLALPSRGIHVPRPCYHERRTTVSEPEDLFMPGFVSGLEGRSPLYR